MPKRALGSHGEEKKKAKTELPEPLKDLKSKFERVNVFYAFCDAKLTTSITLQTIQKSIQDLTLQDLVAINVIIPNFVQFNYINQDVLEIQFGKPICKKFTGNNQDWWSKDNSMPVVKPNVIKKHIEHQSKLFQTALTTFLNRCQEEDLDPSDHILKQVENIMPIYIPLDDDDNWLDPIEPNVGSVAHALNGLRSWPFYDGQLEKSDNQKTFSAKLPVFGDLDLSNEIKDALCKKGIQSLYLHQTEAIQGLRDDKHVIVSTSTASGKSLIYQIPVLESLLKDPSKKALFIFPTKALAQDQKRSLQDMLSCIPSLQDVMISTFDGDTPHDQRTYIRDNASVIFTNPDMLHHAILPNNNRWKTFLLSLKYIVVDELHVYNGLFGSHIAFIMRRLRRLCDSFGNKDYQFISCSATIADPETHMATLFGVNNIKLVNQDGAPHGQKEFIIWNPSLTNPHDPKSERRGAVAEGALLLEYLLENKVRVITFCKTRKSCELLMKHVRESLEKKQKGHVLQKVMSYRGGYTPGERRRIEEKLFNGELLAVVATNALELGVDIGSLDAVLMVGVPWSISAMWQQSGRSGRRNTDSLSFVITDRHPLDQYYATHPLELFNKQPDALALGLESSIALESHLQCAAEELPIRLPDDETYFGTGIKEICNKHLKPIGEGIYRPDPRFRPYPSQYVSIRNASEDTFIVIDVTDNRHVILEEIEVYRAGFEIYEGAIFIHQGRTFLVEECNIDQRYAKVHFVRVDWTTTQRDYTDVDAIRTESSRHIANTNNFISYGEVKVSTTVFGYYRIDKRNRIIDSHDVYMDPIITHSNGVWTDAPAAAIDQLKKLDIDPMAAVHAASHCLISVLPRYTSFAAGNIRTECKNPHATRPRPIRISIYEAEPCGVMRQVYKFFDQILQACLQQIDSCPCEEGCTSCVHLLNCSEHNQVISKEGALIILRTLEG
ncbi:hypothetical protein G6F70_005327 [Rhizopus microsporus]|nr:hypothetical protein G6F71_002459 [Rhizopus microsporus]KAG1198966.1 hypothetical protein G6F70_005327 [Rhizopus microsporus]KAG1210760.1 hypothetical protein G6F69_005181 [Rhizopus microsporus]RCH85802.1 hypothetical protein CU097_003952 [Rhizopus azygosporus]